LQLHEIQFSSFLPLIAILHFASLPRILEEILCHLFLILNSLHIHDYNVLLLLRIFRIFGLLQFLLPCFALLFLWHCRGSIRTQHVRTVKGLSFNWLLFYLFFLCRGHLLRLDRELAIYNGLALEPNFPDFAGSFRFLDLECVQLIIVDEVGKAVFDKYDPFEQEFDVELLQDLVLALVGVFHLRPLVEAAHFLAEDIDIVPDEVNEVHGEMGLGFCLLAVRSPAARGFIGQVRVRPPPSEDLEGDGELVGQTRIDLDHEEHSRDCPYHAPHE